MKLGTMKDLEETKLTMSSALNNASCNHGWLRIVVECIFGMVTVVSFILILWQVVKKGPSEGSHCSYSDCRIICYGAPRFGRYEDDIAVTMAGANRKCDRVALNLYQPMFNNCTLPSKWLYDLKYTIHELAIIGGNLRHISPKAFQSQFTANTRRLWLEDITISNLDSETFAGLENIENLTIQDTAFGTINKNALGNIDRKLKYLKIQWRAKWSPVNITGWAYFPHLTTVDFSLNNFGQILKRGVFSRLTRCQMLYLNYSRITALGPGTFDSLKSIRLLYLNGNHLTNVPTGLFDQVVQQNYQLKIDLQDNYLQCDCSCYEMRHLSKNKYLLEDPICSQPESMKGKYLSRLEEKCNSSTGVLKSSAKAAGFVSENLSETVYMSDDCYDEITNTSSTSIRLVSPINFLTCSSNRIQFGTIDPETFSTRSMFWSGSSHNYLIKPSFILMSDDLSMVEITSPGSNGYGLLWYRSKCPMEIYCVNTLPNFLRVYNIDASSQYTFCPLRLNSGDIDDENCISYNLSPNRITLRRFIYIVFIASGLVCLVLGSLGVYGLIRKYPKLLKGSERILFVKHKNVDALILPPKVPLRSTISTMNNEVTDFNDQNIFVLPNKDLFPSQYFLRTHSVRSELSTSPSYISALEPSEDQLEKWRKEGHDGVTDSSTDIEPYAYPEAMEENIYSSIDANFYESIGTKINCQL